MARNISAVICNNQRLSGQRLVSWLGTVLIYLFLAFLVLIINFPFIWMVLTSLKNSPEVFLIPFKFFPERIVWSNYSFAWRLAPWAAYFGNSLFIAVISMAGQMFFGSLAAYAFTRKFKLNKLIFTLFLGAMMIPGQATMIPNYVIFKSLGWINTYLPLTVPFLTGVFAIFLLRQYFLSIPKDYEDAAAIDGCRAFFYIFRILMPLSSSALITVALLAFNDRWNDYLYSLIMITKNNMRTVQVGLGILREMGAPVSFLMAATTFVTIPVIVLFLFVQKRFIDGVMTGGIKG
ncbi:MAG: carbohydrate ABC transporter permease [Treponema sp.]|jgi:multiple sugar transport system permease protein|nr:carbohydrate ABC transporter permease [Treponema sp.]